MQFVDHIIIIPCSSTESERLPIGLNANQIWSIGIWWELRCRLDAVVVVVTTAMEDEESSLGSGVNEVEEGWEEKEGEPLSELLSDPLPSLLEDELPSWEDLNNPRRCWWSQSWEEGTLDFTLMELSSGGEREGRTSEGEEDEDEEEDDDNVLLSVRWEWVSRDGFREITWCEEIVGWVALAAAASAASRSANTG